MSFIIFSNQVSYCRDNHFSALGVDIMMLCHLHISLHATRLKLQIIYVYVIPQGCQLWMNHSISHGSVCSTTCCYAIPTNSAMKRKCLASKVSNCGAKSIILMGTWGPCQHKNGQQHIEKNCWSYLKLKDLTYQCLALSEMHV